MRLLLDTWSEMVGVNIVDQIKKWDATMSVKDTNAPSPYQFKNPTLSMDIAQNK
ncbi:MAG: hypothetical protein HZC02_04625 [Candidatus Levybacteria bacterium]|nr:hypothetical protein [Candidatus Levybacteria bacterium]